MEVSREQTEEIVSNVNSISSPLEHLDGVSTQIEEIKGDVTALANRLDNIQTEFSELKDSVKRALDNLLPKVEALLANQRPRASCVAEAPEGTAGSTSSLFQAALDGDIEVIASLLADGIDVREWNEVGDSALHVAASAGHERAVIVLLGGCRSVDMRGHHGRTALHCASAEGHVTVIRRLLFTGAEVDATDRDGNSALVHAAKAKKWEVVQLLLQRGASAEKYKGDDNSSLYLVGKGKNYSLIQFMLQQMKEKEKQMKLALLKCNDTYLVYVFQDAVPEFSRSEGAGDTMTQLAVNGKVDVLRAMLDVGADIDAFTPNRYSCLMCAAFNGKVEVLKMLLDRGACVNLRHSTDNSTALHRAASGGHVECVRVLLEAGAQVNIHNSSGTPINVAKTEEIRLLLRSHSSQS